MFTSNVCKLLLLINESMFVAAKFKTNDRNKSASFYCRLSLFDSRCIRIFKFASKYL